MLCRSRALLSPRSSLRGVRTFFFSLHVHLSGRWVQSRLLFSPCPAIRPRNLFSPLLLWASSARSLLLGLFPRRLLRRLRFPFEEGIVAELLRATFALYRFCVCFFPVVPGASAVHFPFEPSALLKPCVFFPQEPFFWCAIPRPFSALRTPSHPSFFFLFF